jgi:hypothetical protein
VLPSITEHNRPSLDFLDLVAATPQGGEIAMEENRQEVNAKGFVPFDQFLEDTRAARFEEYENAPGARAADRSSFEEMKAYLAFLYQGVTVRHSFVQVDGHYIDCVLTEQQPALRGSAQPSCGCTVPPGTPVASEPMKSEAQGQPRTRPVATHLRGGSQDRFGNEMTCPEGTIPMRRITLAELTRFPKVADFLGK